MSALSFVLVILSLGAVVLALGLGVFNMARGGPPSRSQTFMRWRISLQFLAIVVLMVSLYFATR